MKIIADLHLHSKYSRAVSQQMVPEVMAAWAVKKGINLLATADWTHPLWIKELEASLEEEGEGVYGLKKWEMRNEKKNTSHLSFSPKFILSTEISSIYSQGGKTRRIHNVVMAPSFKTAYKINDELKRRGCNLMSDGRPIIGLSSIQLAELVWSIDKNVIIVPAHIWTPWFSMFGSKSGFDSIEECWGKYAKNIYAIETGLSSDPAMNWRIKQLDTRSILSFSDAHSPAKLGREAVVFKVKREKANKVKSFDFKDLSEAIKRNGKLDWEIGYTIEFYPQEGKYHYSGHRKCGIKHSPKDTAKKGTTCPVCGKLLTLGVEHRVSQLSKKPIIKPLKKENKAGLVGYYNKHDKTRPPYVMLVPLLEILSESLGVGVTSQKVQNEYENIVKNLAPEFEVLTQTKIEQIKAFCGEKVAMGIEKVRKGDIVVEPGYDGVFGTVKIWPPSAKTTKDKVSDNDIIDNKREQMSLL